MHITCVISILIQAILPFWDIIQDDDLCDNMNMGRSTDVEIFLKSKHDKEMKVLKILRKYELYRKATNFECFHLIL